LQGQEQARAPQGSQPLPRQAPRPRRTSQRPAQALEDPDQATLLPTPSRSPGQGHPRPPEPRAQPTLKKVQYTCIRYAERLDQIGAARSVGDKGDSFDNAVAESLNSLYKKELIDFRGGWENVMDVT